MKHQDTGQTKCWKVKISDAQTNLFGFNPGIKSLQGIHFGVPDIIIQLVGEHEIVLPGSASSQIVVVDDGYRIRNLVVIIVKS